MDKKTKKSKPSKSMKNLPEKTVDAKNAKAVKGGGISLSYSQIQQEYKEQK